MASNWDPFNIILIVTGVEVIIRNCLPEVHKILPDFRNWGGKFPIMVDDASCHLSRYTSMHVSIWHRYRDMAPQRQWGHELDLLGSRDVMGHVTIQLPRVDFLGMVHSDMRLSSTVMEIWLFKVLPGRLFQEQRSSILHWFHILLFTTLRM